jgi:hypothetical protein
MVAGWGEGGGRRGGVGGRGDCCGGRGRAGAEWDGGGAGGRCAWTTNTYPWCAVCSSWRTLPSRVRLSSSTVGVHSARRCNSRPVVDVPGLVGGLVDAWETMFLCKLCHEILAMQSVLSFASCACANSCCSMATGLRQAVLESALMATRHGIIAMQSLLCELPMCYQKQLLLLCQRVDEPLAVRGGWLGASAYVFL